MTKASTAGLQKFCFARPASRTGGLPHKWAPRKWFDSSAKIRFIRGMKPNLIQWIAFACSAFSALFGTFAAEPAKTIGLWPNGAPGEKGNIGGERDMTTPSDELIAGRRVIRLGNVSIPTISLYR